MSTIRERINAHLPILLQLLSTASLVVIALAALCGSQSLKELAGFHELGEATGLHNEHNH